MDSTQNGSHGSWRNRAHGRRHWWLLLVLPLALGGVIVARAYAQGPGMFGPGFGPMGGPEHKAFMMRRLEKMLDDVKATDTQRSAIKGIVERLHTEMEPIHNEHAKLHEDMVKVFSAQTVDAAAVEKLRAQGVALMEKGSQALSRALVDAANVLNAEQRQTIIKHIQEHHGRGLHGRM